MSTGTTLILNCPSCTKVIYPLNSKSNLVTCTCGKVVFKQPNGLLKETSFPVIEKTNDIIQPGTKGIWQSKIFTVTGRLRVWFDEKVLNYWSVLFEDGTHGYLEEGYGIYTVVTPDDSVQPLLSSKLGKLKTGSIIDLKVNKQYILNEKYEADKLEVEGDLVIQEFPDKFHVFDFSSDDGKNCLLIELSQDKVLCFSSSHNNFNDLQLTNLRKPDSSVFSFKCQDCPEQIVVKTYPYAQSCACKRCGVYYQLQSGKGFMRNGKKTDDFTPVLAIGTKGIVNGVEYEVMGCVQKEEDNAYHSRWREYTLYNQAAGFAFLSEFDGHWIILKEQADAPVLLNESIRNFTYAGESFALFNAYQHIIIFASGEFPYNIFDNYDTNAKEFISPPEIWIREKNKKEGIRWYFGKHISPSEVKNAFPVEYSLPLRIGTGAVQPKGYMNPVKLAVTAFIGILFLMLIHALNSSFKEQRIIYENSLLFNDSTFQASAVSEKFELKKDLSNVEFTIDASVSNSWVEVAIALVSTTTGKEYSLEQGVEYYRGYSDGESWSEGGTNATAYLTAIPSDTYILQIQAVRDPADFNIKTVQVKAVYDVESTRNLVFAIAFILIWAIGKYYLDQFFEKNRWYNSPYSNYDNED